MKNVKFTYVLIAVSVVSLAGYWYVTRQSEAYQENRNLIAGNRIQLGQETEVKPVSMTKKEAYAKRFKETANEKAKLDFALENQRPQKLAASVTQAMKGSYQTKIEELKSDARTTRVYAGQTYTAGEPSHLEEGALTQQLTTTVQQQNEMRKEKITPVYRASLPKRKPEVSVKVEEDPTLANAPIKETKFFNTTAVKSPSVPEAAQTKQTSASAQSDPQVIKASVFGQQTVKAGTLLKVRLLERVTISGVTFERNTFFSGACTFGQDRLLVTVNKIPMASGGYKSVALSLLDADDYQEGLYAPSDNTKENAVEAATSGVENIISNVNTPGLGIGTGVARVFRSAVNGAQKITVPDGHTVIFISKAP